MVEDFLARGGTRREIVFFSNPCGFAWLSSLQQETKDAELSITNWVTIPRPEIVFLSNPCGFAWRRYLPYSKKQRIPDTEL